MYCLTIFILFFTCILAQKFITGLGNEIYNVSGTGKMRLLEEKSPFQILTYLHRTFYSEHYSENLV